MGRGDIYIIPDDTQCGIIALASENSVTHFLRLFLHPILPKRLGGNSYEAEYVAVLTYERAVWLDVLRHSFSFLLLSERVFFALTRQECF